MKNRIWWKFDYVWLVIGIFLDCCPTKNTKNPRWRSSTTSQKLPMRCQKLPGWIKSLGQSRSVLVSFNQSLSVWVSLGQSWLVLVILTNCWSILVSCDLTCDWQLDLTLGKEAQSKPKIKWKWEIFEFYVYVQMWSCSQSMFWTPQRREIIFSNQSGKYSIRKVTNIQHLHPGPK